MIHEVMHMVLTMPVTEEAKVVAISEIIKPRGHASAGCPRIPKITVRDWALLESRSLMGRQDAARSVVGTSL